MQTTETMRRMAALGGGLAAALQPTLPYIAICTLAIFYDCYTAWSLSRRVRKAFPRQGQDAGKFSSHKFGKVVACLAKSYALIVFAFLIETYITTDWPVRMTKVAAGAVCFWQLWSILENEASCNGARWARVARKFLADKTKRHLNIDIDSIK